MTDRYEEVCQAGDVAPGQMRAVTVGGNRLVVANVSGSFYALGAVCSHEHAYLDEGMLVDEQIYCPRHFSSFDVRTGEAVAPPAECPVPAYRVRVEEGRVLVGPPVDGSGAAGPADGIAGVTDAQPSVAGDVPGPTEDRDIPSEGTEPAPLGQEGRYGSPRGEVGLGERLAGWIAHSGAVQGASEVAMEYVSRARRRYEGLPVVEGLHGRWLGHPLHPALSDLPIGIGTGALLLGAWAPTERGAKVLRAATLASGVAAALTGVADWTVSEGTARRIGLVHGALNLLGLCASAGSVLADAGGARRLAARTHGVAVSLMIGAGYLGGHLVLGKGVMVDHTAWLRGPVGWTDVAGVTEIGEGQLHAREVGGRDVLLWRSGGQIAAIEGNCSHAGAPLKFGTVCEGRVTCPWHGSQFRLSDGRVVRGPACFSQPLFQTRVLDGRLQVRRGTEVAG